MLRYSGMTMRGSVFGMVFGKLPPCVTVSLYADTQARVAAHTHSRSSAGLVSVTDPSGARAFAASLRGRSATDMSARPLALPRSLLFRREAATAVFTTVGIAIGAVSSSVELLAGFVFRRRCAARASVRRSM